MGTEETDGTLPSGAPHRPASGSDADDERVARLAGGVAHTLNNLLASIIGFASIVAETFDDEDPRSEAMSEILLSSERAAQLTDQLLALAGRQMFDPMTMALNDLVLGLEPGLRAAFGESAQIELDLTEQAQTVWVDPDQFGRALSNVVQNASEASTDAGRIVIRTGTVDAEVADLPDTLGPGSAVITVSDDGVGMDPETARCAFEPFFANNARGRGLGLAVVKGIIEQGRGVARIDSALGEGTTLRLYLPAEPVTTRA